MCPTRYRTRWLADRCSVSQQLGALQTHTTDTFLFISHTTNVLLFKFLCNIFMPGSVASGTLCTLPVATRLRRNVLRILILQKENRGKKKPLYITTQTQQKQKKVFTSHATSCMSNRQCIPVTNVNSRGDELRKLDDIQHTSSTLS